MTSEVLKRIDLLAAKLGVAANDIWMSLLRQARVELFTDWAVLILCPVVLWLLWRVCVGMRDRIEACPQDRWGIGKEGAEIYWIAIIVSTASAVIVSIVMIIAALEVPTLFWNPQYWALTKIFETLK